MITSKPLLHLAIVGLLLAPALPSLASTPDPAGPWPTLGPWLETAHVTPDDANQPGGKGHPAHYGVAFGARIALDGDAMIVGTQSGHLTDQDGMFEDGGDWAYIFERGPDGAWHQTAKLIPDDAHGGDTFAFSVDIDDEAGVAVVGNPGPVEATNRAYIFERQANGTWAQTATLERTNPGADHGGEFGHDVAVSGNTVAVALTHGRFGEDPFTYLFEKIDDRWLETASLKFAGGEIDLSGDRLIGLYGEMTACVDTEPCAHLWVAIHDRVEGEWVAGPILDPTAEDNRSRTLITRLALSEDGRTALLGAPVDCRVYGLHTQHRVSTTTPFGPVYGTTPCPGSVGSAWIYEFVDGRWVQAADLANPDPSPSDTFGVSVDVDGNLAVIGAYGDDLNGADGGGAAYVYERVAGLWTLTSKLRNHDNGPVGGADFFGEAVGTNGVEVVVGAPFDDQRGDDVPPPWDDANDLQPAICEAFSCSGPDDGADAGSVYLFERADTAALHRVLG